ncbi:MAG: MerR family transcriptional regulator [Candidatus Sericytochromatia bacterium]
MAYNKTIQDISEYTGLKYDYIRRAIFKMEAIFEPYINRGNKNTILFDSDRLEIFDRIKNLKSQGLTLKSIKKHLEKELNISNTVIETSIITENNSDMKIILKEFQEVTKVALHSKEQTIIAQNLYIKELEDKLSYFSIQNKQIENNKGEILEEQLSKILELQNTLRDKESEIIVLKKQIQPVKKSLTNKLKLIFTKTS